MHLFFDYFHLLHCLFSTLYTFNHPPDSEATGLLTSIIGYIIGDVRLERACWCHCRVRLQGAA